MKPGSARDSQDRDTGFIAQFGWTAHPHIGRDPRRTTLQFVRDCLRMLALLPVLACLVTAWVIAALVAAAWIGIALLCRRETTGFDE